MDKQDEAALAATLQSEEVTNFLASQERLTHSSLAALMDMISASQKIKLVRGETFQYNANKHEMTYDEALLLSLPPAAAPGLIWHNTGHATDSQPQTVSIRKTVQDINRATQGQIPEKSIYNILEAMEDERMEKLLRDRWGNLGNTYLPRIDKGWRTDSWQKIAKETVTPSPQGQTNKDGLPVFWDRVSNLIRGIESGAMDIKDLPPDIQWDQQLVDQIKKLKDCPTVDNLLQESQSVISQVVQQSLNLPPPPPPNGPGNKNGGQGQPSNGPGQPGKGQGQAGPRQEGGFDRRKERSDSQGNSNQQTPESFVNGGESAGFEPGVIDRSYHGPPWSVVLKTVENMTGPIRTQVRRYLKDNETEDTDSGFTSGTRVNARALRQALVARHNKVFNRPVVNSQRSYAVLFVVDTSGSMSSGYSGATTNGLPLDPWLGKSGASSKSRIALAMRMAVAIVNVLDKYREVVTGVGCFEGHCTMVKSISKRWDESMRQKVMDLLHPRGGTVCDGILETVPKEFAKVKADKKLCIVLSDGDISPYKYSEAQVQKMVTELRNKHDIEFAVLTVGCPDDTAKALFGKQYCDKIDETNVGPVLGKHLKRMVKGK